MKREEECFVCLVRGSKQRNMRSGVAIRIWEDQRLDRGCALKKTKPCFKENTKETHPRGKYRREVVWGPSPGCLEVFDTRPKAIMVTAGVACPYPPRKYAQHDDKPSNP